jgi:competence protein ComGC
MGSYSISKTSSNTKAVSTLVEILFLLSITSLLVGVVLINYHSVYKNIQDMSTRATLSNIAGKIAQDVHTVYILSTKPGDLILKKKLEIPQEVGGMQYLIELKEGKVIVKQGTIEVEAIISSETPIKESAATSFNAYLVYNLTEEKIGVVNQ